MFPHFPNFLLGGFSDGAGNCDLSESVRNVLFVPQDSDPLKLSVDLDYCRSRVKAVLNTVHDGDHRFTAAALEQRKDDVRAQARPSLWARL